MDNNEISRRSFLAALGGSMVAASFFPLSAFGQPKGLITKKIPSSGEALPVIGMGTWRTFNVGGDKKLRDERTLVLQAFFKNGGRIIDSSPMYGSSADVVGYGLDKLDMPDRLFSAEKVWTREGDATAEQIAQQRKEWGVAKFDLIQVHNLLAWKEHLETLQKLKAAGKIGYVGITTSHGRRHDELEKIMKSEDIDFVQLTYNMLDREAEKRLLPLAAERKIAVIANRPFRGGSLVDRVKGKYPLPDWASEIGCKNWPQFLLKFIVSHPAITCAIPATSKVAHMRENMGAARGELPDQKTRHRMLRYLASL